MKKLLLTLIVLIACALCLSSCELINSIIPCNHKETVTDSAVAPTCTESGLTEGSHCARCGEVVVEQQTVPALGHTEIIDEAVVATCTEDGLTAGVHCSVCNTTVIAQEVIPAAHNYGEWETVSEGDCFTPGEQKRACSVCSEEEVEKSVALGHSFVQNEETKLFYCEICDARIFAGHLYAAFDVEMNWYDAYKYCDALGGHLVTITSQMEQDLLTELVNGRTPPTNRVEYYYFTGGLKNTSGWKWITGEEMSYTHWGPQIEGDQWYIGLTTTLVSSSNKKMKVGDWEDLSHAENYAFICEWELDIVEDEHYFTEWEITTEATCFNDGEQYRVCTHCGVEETAVLPQLEHNFIFNEASGVTACELCSAAMYDGRIYKIFTVSLSWFDAYTYCNELGGHLITITSKNEQTFLETYMNSQNYTSRTWLGGYDDGSGFKWVTGEDFEYSNWYPGEPNHDGGTGYFLATNHDKSYFGLWHDNTPFITRYFICEWDAE